MHQKLLEKYFRDQCSEKELKMVLDWFQTDEGRTFLKEDINRQNRRFLHNSRRFLYPAIKSEKIFARIQLNKKAGLKRSRWFILRVASILLIALGLSSLLYWKGVISLKNKKPEPAFITYLTAPGQQKVFNLSDGVKIRLNEKSTLTIPKEIYANRRRVRLKGEAFFEVTHKQDHPFVVEVNGAIIKDLGTEFNVKTDSIADNVQVAVMRGKVSLKEGGNEHKTAAILTKNHFGIIWLSDSQMIIEKGDVKNYLSWIDNRLVFHGKSLTKVSRQLERLYDVQIEFESAQLKRLNLTADFEKVGLRKVLTIISHTLDIHFVMHETHVVWMK